MARIKPQITRGHARQSALALLLPVQGTPAETKQNPEEKAGNRTGTTGPGTTDPDTSTPIPIARRQPLVAARKPAQNSGRARHDKVARPNGPERCRGPPLSAAMHNMVCLPDRLLRNAASDAAGAAIVFARNLDPCHTEPLARIVAIAPVQMGASTCGADADEMPTDNRMSGIRLRRGDRQ